MTPWWWRPPPDAISQRLTVVLLALIETYRRDGRATVRSVATTAGFASYGDVHGDLRKLRAMGLCDWTDHKVGTLRPTVQLLTRRSA